MGDGPPRSLCRHRPQTAQMLLLRVVWEAYRHVKANRGAAGIDGESMEMFVRSARDCAYQSGYTLACSRHYAGWA